MDRGAWWATAQVVTGLDMTEPVRVVVAVQLSSNVRLFATPWTAARQASLSLSISWSLPKFIAFVMRSNHLILWHPLLPLPSIFPSIGDFSNELSVRIRWPKYRIFSFSINPFSEYLGLISLKIDWFDLPAVQGTFKSLLQHHSLKASILWHSAFFMVHLTTVHDHWEDHSLMWLPWWLRPPYYRLKLILTAPNKLCNMRLLTQQKYINLQVKNVSIRA